MTSMLLRLSLLGRLILEDHHQIDYPYLQEACCCFQVVFIAVLPLAYFLVDYRVVCFMVILLVAFLGEAYLDLQQVLVVDSCYSLEDSCLSSCLILTFMGVVTNYFLHHLNHRHHHLYLVFFTFNHLLLFVYSWIQALALLEVHPPQRQYL